MDWRLPDRHYDNVTLPGTPYFILFGLSGMAASILRGGKLYPVRLSWCATLLGVWFIVMLTGVVNSRYYFVFEPFVLIYALYLADSLIAAVRLPRAGFGAHSGRC